MAFPYSLGVREWHRLDPPGIHADGDRLQRGEVFRRRRVDAGFARAELLRVPVQHRQPAGVEHDDIALGNRDALRVHRSPYVVRRATSEEHTSELHSLMRTTYA